MGNVAYSSVVDVTQCVPGSWKAAVGGYDEVVDRLCGVNLNSYPFRIRYAQRLVRIYVPRISRHTFKQTHRFCAIPLDLQLRIPVQLTDCQLQHGHLIP